MWLTRRFMHPSEPVPRSIRRGHLRNLPGLNDVINQVRLIFEGTNTPAAPDGRIIVETY